MSTTGNPSEPTKTPIMMSERIHGSSAKYAATLSGCWEPQAAAYRLAKCTRAAVSSGEGAAEQASARQSTGTSERRIGVPYRVRA